jgi:hypothetical protein
VIEFQAAEFSIEDDCFRIRESAHQGRHQIPATDATGAGWHSLLVQHFTFGTAPAVVLQRCAPEFVIQIYSESLKTLDSLRHQDKTHACILAAADALIDTTAMPAPGQSNRGHQTSNPGAKNRSFHNSFSPIKELILAQ